MGGGPQEERSDSVSQPTTLEELQQAFIKNVPKESKTEESSANAVTPTPMFRNMLLMVIQIAR